MILKLNVARSLCSQVSAVPFCISKGNGQHNEDTLNDIYEMTSKYIYKKDAIAL